MIERFMRLPSFGGDAGSAPNTGIEDVLGIREGVQTSRVVNDRARLELEEPRHEAGVADAPPGAPIPSMQDIPA